MSKIYKYLYILLICIIFNTASNLVYMFLYTWNSDDYLLIHITIQISIIEGVLIGFILSIFIYLFMKVTNIKILALIFSILVIIKYLSHLFGLGYYMLVAYIFYWFICIKIVNRMRLKNE